jgi:hypothetical protein
MTVFDYFELVQVSDQPYFRWRLKNVTVAATIRSVGSNVSGDKPISTESIRRRGRRGVNHATLLAAGRDAGFVTKLYLPDGLPRPRELGHCSARHSKRPRGCMQAGTGASRFF